MRSFKKSAALLQRAERVLPGGVNSPVRAFKSVGGTPPFVVRAEGPRVWDAEGQEYVDLIGSYGPMILGHAHPAVTAALEEAIHRGTSYGCPTEGEIALAETIVEMVPSIEMLRLVNSGTEATMSALRVARAATGRDAFVKFNGCYHGHGDAFLVKAGSGAITLGTPDSPGVPGPVVANTLVADFNDLEGVRRLFEERGRDIAAIFVEPVAGNMGLVPPEPGFLEGLRELCDAHGALLVFDEVMTGFRLAPGGVQELCGVTPDLTTLGKIIGGGLPVGAYGGRKELMDHVAPRGSVYQAGTLSGNPLAVAAGRATLNEIGKPGFYESLEDKGAYLQAGLEHIIESLGVEACVQRRGSMLTVFFTKGPVKSVADVQNSDLEAFKRWFHRLLEEGVMIPPSAFEAWFLSSALGDDALDHVLDAARTAFRSL